MYKSCRIGVVIPAHNESAHIAKVINGIPGSVDHIYVVNDGSTDDTLGIVYRTAQVDNRVHVLTHHRKSGVGAAIETGYRCAFANDTDITVTMDGDNQMDPSEMPRLLEPILSGHADYTKATRMRYKSHSSSMPKFRYIGNWILKWLTRIAAGSNRITDPQSGYTAISRKALGILLSEHIFPYYGCYNDILVKLLLFGIAFVEVPMPARYADEKSKIRYSRYIPKVSGLLLRLFIRRIRWCAQTH